ncbi:hypothetical protein V1523DRAFT_28441 [Lipomyces doorenjongii]
MFFVIVGGIVTIIVLAMPKMHASSHFFWASFTENSLTGWSGGAAFLCGVLNGAFTIGTPDAITHIAEELPRPTRDLPVAIGLQIGLGFLYAFCFAIALCYAITDLNALFVRDQRLSARYDLFSGHGQCRRNIRTAFHHLLLVDSLHSRHCVDRKFRPIALKLFTFTLTHNPAFSHFLGART